MMPWSFLLPWALWRHRGRYRTHAAITFLASWAIGTLIIFELVSTKLVHYFLPAYPSLAVLFAAALVGRFADQGLGIRQISRVWIGWAMMSMGVFVIVATTIFALSMLPQELGVPTGITAAVAGLGLILSGRILRDGRYRLAFVTQTAIGTLSIILAGAKILPAVYSSQVVVEVAQRLRERGEAGQPVALWGYRHPSLVYNVGHPLAILDETRPFPPFLDARRFAQENGAFSVP